VTRPSAKQSGDAPSAPMLSFASTREFERWLEANHETASAIWLKIAKKGAPERTLSYGEAIDVGLCFGWIDGQKERLDEHYWLQRFTPRTARSPWSKINRERAERLMADGRMRSAGMAAVERARSDGRWDAAYDGSRTAAVPDDLRQELDRQPPAAAAFEALDARNRYSIIYRINEARRPETRERRIAKYVDMLLRDERIHR
jgi:uncharacterized protein YdeI (YjbR/CyaY-like superfamily)